MVIRNGLSPFVVGDVDARRVARQRPGTRVCYFVSSLRAILDTAPNFLHTHARKEADGAYTFMLYRKRHDGVHLDLPIDPVEVRVHPNELPSFGHSTQPKELWFALYEAAFTKVVGGTDAAAGGLATIAFEVLLGSKSRHIFFTDRANRSDGEFAKELRAELVAGNVLVASSRGQYEMPKDAHGVIAHHDYSVWDAGVDSKGPYVEVGNPHGHGEPMTGLSVFRRAKDGVNDGDFRLPMSEFRRLFHAVSVGALADAQPGFMAEAP